MKVNEIISDISSEVNDTVKEVLRKINLDNSNMAKKIDISYKVDNVYINMPDYAFFVDKGRKAGKRPPIKPILRYIRERGIRTGRLSEEQLAFAIANSIAKKGIKPRPFVESLTQEVTELITQEIYSEMNKLIKKTLK